MPASNIQDRVRTGRVKWYALAKGYGFITSDGADAEDVFVHSTAVDRANLKFLTEGQQLRFRRAVRLHDGKPFATYLEVLDSPD